MPSICGSFAVVHRPLAHAEKVLDRLKSPTTSSSHPLPLLYHTLDDVVHIFAVISRESNSFARPSEGFRKYAQWARLHHRFVGFKISSRHRRERAKSALRCIIGIHTQSSSAQEASVELDQTSHSRTRRICGTHCLDRRPVGIRAISLSRSGQRSHSRAHLLVGFEDCRMTSEGTEGLTATLSLVGYRYHRCY